MKSASIALIPLLIIQVAIALPGSTVHEQGAYEIIQESAGPLWASPGTDLDPVKERNVFRETPLVHPQQPELELSRAEKEQAAMRQRKYTMISLLGAMSGVGGTLCFKRFSFFVHMMTGGFIRTATALSNGVWQTALYDMSLVLSYASGCTIYRFFDIHHKSRKDSPSALPVSIASAALLAFLIGDIMNQILPMSSGKSMAPFFAIGFGLVNAFSMNTVGAVTNAATGHLTRVSVGVADTITFGAPTKNCSPRYMLSFFGSILVTSFLCNQATGTPLNALRLLPLGCCIGSMYAAILVWYSGVFNNQS